ncbi:PhnD/SsuA/transferrin family substrate-binding protein [Oceanimonas sp. CHS3-5]|uniref:PhnD/SsuA/transferrin family substrate-binding protein n=1 Tax=Oceanimonas sp. CHS3-5 TaxID=3068186 RepID=UPI00273E76AA|nr:PhnD/SsuA/transferrin family substrate-binding protein [Oceanimonas sp. CHS3-5]MDP5290966.1 PhnD/SsuA/transferrin family substrate-binding protein [Oceanimonas sp. CHS3-5]
MLPALAQGADYRVGFLAYRGEAQGRAQWQPVIDSLNRALPAHHFDGVFLTQQQLDQALADGRLDFVVTNPAHYVLSRHQGLNWLASWLDPRFGSARESVAATLLVRADTGISTSQQLAGRRVGAVHEQAFGGYLLVAEQLRRRGVALASLDLQFRGYPVDALVYLLRDGALDAAMVPACTLEQMAEEGLVDPAGFRALMVQADAPCVRSTPLYPGWSFAAVNVNDEVLLRAMTRALLAQEQQGRPLWGAPIRLDEVEQLLRDWRPDAGEAPTWQTLRSVLLGYWQWLAGLMLVLLVIALHHVRVTRLLLKRTDERDRLHHLIQSREQELARARQATLLGEMATGLAHELNQPLSAIQAYAQAGELMTAEQNSREVFDHIVGETERGADIIRRFRQWASQPLPGADAFAPRDLCRELAQRLTPRANAAGVKLEVNAGPGTLLSVRPAVEQIVSNLLGNSLDAFERRGQGGRLRLAAGREEGGWRLTVDDDAGGVSPVVIEALGHTLPASRIHGMGIGLMVSYRLARRLGGRLTLDNVNGGTQAQLFLPEEE